MRRFFSKLLYVFFGLPLIFSSLMLLSVRPWAMDRDYYKSIVTDDKLYEAILSPELAKEAELRMELGKAVFNGPALMAAVQENLPRKEIQALGVELVDDMVDLVEGKARGGPELDLRPLKAALEKATPEIAGDYVRALPETKDSLQPGDLTARPASLSPAQAEKAAGAALREATASLPEVWKGENVKIDLGPSGLFGQAALNRAALTTTALSLALVAGLAAMGGGGLALILSRAGGMLIGPSALILALGGVLFIPGASILANNLPDEARVFLSSGSGAAFRGYLASVLGVMARGFFLTGLIGVSAGGFLKSTKRFLLEAPKDEE